MRKVYAMTRSRPLSLEVLEYRAVPANFGITWADPRHLTLSFAPDATPISGGTSSLFGTLNAEMSTAAWESQILRAVQTWTVNANLSVGVVPDGGQPFGTSGLPEGDPRFGDIRIGARPMSADVVAISVPYDPSVSGTWAGDVVLNSNVDFTAPGSNLYVVMLHEFGHVFGLPDSNDSTSVMYHNTSSTGTPVALSPADVAAFQGLYGQHPIDPNELTGSNNSFQTATPIRYPTSPQNFDLTTPLVAYGVLTAPGDVDVYSLRTPHYHGPMTFIVQTAGVSLLRPQLTVYDAAGTVVGQAQSTNILGDTVTVKLDHVLPNAVYYLGVRGATRDLFSVGRYGVAATFDNKLDTSADQIAAVLRAPFDVLPASQIDKLFRDPNATLDSDHSWHGSLQSALVLTTTSGFAPNRHYEVIDAVRGGRSAYYLVHAPQNASGAPVVLTASVNSLRVNGAMAQLQVLDSNGNPIAATVLVNGGGTYTLQVGNLSPGQDYYLQLTVPKEPDAKHDLYSVVVDFRGPLASLRTFVSGTLTLAAAQQSYALYLAQTQMFQFALTLNQPSAPTTAAVEFILKDQAGNVVLDLTAGAGQTVSCVSVLLHPGAYTATFTAKITGAMAPLAYRLRGNSITDPIGPALNDPTLQPQYTTPPPGTSSQPGDALYYYYPGGIISIDPFLWMPLAV
jgi:hypothetical protein